MGNLVVGAVVGRSEMIGRTITSSNWPTALCLSDFPDALDLEGAFEQESYVTIRRDIQNYQLWELLPS